MPSQLWRIKSFSTCRAEDIERTLACHVAVLPHLQQISGQVGIYLTMWRRKFSRPMTALTRAFPGTMQCGCTLYPRKSLFCLRLTMRRP